MSLPLPQHRSVIEMLDSQHIALALSLAVSAAWLAAELLSMPRSRKQLDIPRGDWLTVGLGVLPVIGVAASILWQYFVPAQRLHPALVAPGVALCLAGIGLRTWSRLALGRFYTFSIDLTEGHRVLAEGPYRYVRHPLYLGTFLVVAGLPLLAQSWAAVWLLTVPTALAYAVRLVREDAYLIERLGAEYQIYARRTARLIPFVW